ncbi:MAG: hypothetical protein M5U09_17715 [Gammaproteobacteria bacterium]|nr:hypothetical protein [Gammaproteobacteria bacterium]
MGAPIAAPVDEKRWNMATCLEARLSLHTTPHSVPFHAMRGELRYSDPVTTGTSAMARAPVASTIVKERSWFASRQTSPAWVPVPTMSLSTDCVSVVVSRTSVPTDGGAHQHEPVMQVRPPVHARVQEPQCNASFCRS